MNGPQLASLHITYLLQKSFGFREIQNVLCPKHSFFSFLTDYVNIYISFRFIYTYLIKTFHSISGRTKIEPNTLAFKRPWNPETCCKFCQTLASWKHKVMFCQIKLYFNIHWVFSLFENFCPILTLGNCWA